MNCEDIDRILNDSAIDTLGPLTLDRVREHLASCPECARDWSIHEQMLAMSVPSATLSLLRWRPAQRDGSPARAASTRRPRGRFLIVGALLAAGGAAALITVISYFQDRESQEASAFQETPERTSERDAQRENPTTTAPAAVADSNASADRQAAAAYPYRFTVAVAPIAFRANDEIGMSALRNIHEALINRLRSVPHLTLIGPDSSARYLRDDGQPLWPLSDEIDFLLQLGRPVGDFYRTIEGQTGVLRIDFYLFIASNSRVGSGNTDIGIEQAENAIAALTAADKILNDMLRRYFPPEDLGVLAEIRNRALDNTLADEDRFDALEELASLQFRFVTLADDVQESVHQRIASTAVEIATISPDPEIRRRVWETMGSVRAPYLVGALADSLLRDSSEAVRLEAARQLAGNYLGDPAALAALDFAGKSDSARQVRNLATWATLDDPGRRALVTGMLTAMNMPATERFGIVLSDLPEYQQYIGQDAAAALMAIAVATGENDTRWQIISDLGNAPSADVVGLLLTRLGSDPDDAVRRVAAAALIGHQDAPGVVDALRYARDNDPSPGVRLAAITVR